LDIFECPANQRPPVTAISEGQERGHVRVGIRAKKADPREAECPMGALPDGESVWKGNNGTDRAPGGGTQTGPGDGGEGSWSAPSAA
jgi:hypothetical protein